MLGFINSFIGLILALTIITRFTKHLRNNVFFKNLLIGLYISASLVGLYNTSETNMIIVIGLILYITYDAYVFNLCNTRFNCEPNLQYIDIDNRRYYREMFVIEDNKSRKFD